jgi:hypothetical protein
VQLHHVLAAVDSTEVADEHQDRGPVPPQGAEVDRGAALVENRHRCEIIGAAQHGDLRISLIYQDNGKIVSLIAA